MSFELDEEILQDFLVEAGEILEGLGEQLVEMEQRPDDADLLNAIFRGFHTVKGGAGFLQLNALVDCCHIAENVFDILRKGERQVSAELMDTVLQALDAVNDMFAQVNNGEDPTPADQSILDQLQLYAKPESQDEVAADQAEIEDQEEVTVDQEKLIEDEPSDQNVSEPFVSEGSAGDDITDDEFEQLLDAISPVETDKATTTPSSTEQIAESSVASEPESDSDEITDDEFEALLDQLHGKGSFTGAQDDKPPVTNDDQPDSIIENTPIDAAESDSDEITDDEFEALLDQLHGKGGFTGAKELPPVVESKETSKKVEPTKKTKAKVAKKAEKTAKKGVSKTTTPADVAGSESTDAKPTGSKAAPAKASKVKGASDKSPISQETTVRVDTKRLDDIMNMVGELVLVRNRLVRLGGQYNDEGLQKAVSNLDVVTADLQTSVMKTRMQPIKKVFGRFPRVVRDLARTLKKEINLELIGEETDLDKNLVEALSDPLVHLVRNSVDHGIELPAAREKSGKPRTGKVVLSAQQEGDHILLMIEDDGAGMDPNLLRGLAVKRGLMDEEAADRLTDSECYALIFAPGFSTKEKISDVSGRGVGMDVVKTKITQLNGSVDIESEMEIGRAHV